MADNPKSSLDLKRSRSVGLGALAARVNTTFEISSCNCLNPIRSLYSWILLICGLEIVNKKLSITSGLNSFPIKSKALTSTDVLSCPPYLGSI